MPQNDIHSQLLEKVRAYKMPPKAFELLDRHKPLILVGTTAAGKDTVTDFIEQNSDWHRMVTHTTRPMRAGEANGKTYWFVTEEEMLKLLETESMIETKELHQQQVSGTSIGAYQTVIDSGHNPILPIDVHGTVDIIKHAENVQPYFILPPSFEEWMRRLEKRGGMTHAEKSRRFKSATDELNVAIKNEKFIFVVNSEVAQVAAEILGGRSDPVTQHHNRILAQELIEDITAHHF